MWDLTTASDKQNNTWQTGQKRGKKSNCHDGLRNKTPAFAKNQTWRGFFAILHFLESAHRTLSTVSLFPQKIVSGRHWRHTRVETEQMLETIKDSKASIHTCVLSIPVISGGKATMITFSKLSTDSTFPVSCGAASCLAGMRNECGINDPLLCDFLRFSFTSSGSSQTLRASTAEYLPMMRIDLNSDQKFDKKITVHSCSLTALHMQRIAYMYMHTSGLILLLSAQTMLIRGGRNFRPVLPCMDSKVDWKCRSNLPLRLFCFALFLRFVVNIKLQSSEYASSVGKTAMLHGSWVHASCLSKQPLMNDASKKLGTIWVCYHGTQECKNFLFSSLCSVPWWRLKVCLAPEVNYRSSRVWKREPGRTHLVGVKFCPLGATCVNATKDALGWDFLPVPCLKITLTTPSEHKGTKRTKCFQWLCSSRFLWVWVGGCELERDKLKKR